jgi:long-chain fatty acid transport protein
MRCPFLVGLALLLATAASARGAGYAVLEKSASSLGSAFAGESAAGEEDASILYGNPAGMTLFDRTQLASSGFAILPSATFENDGSRLGPESGGAPLRGGDGGDAGSLALVPAFFLIHPVGDRLRLGLGAFGPFGLTTSWEDGWIGRYHAHSSSLFTVTVNPNVAYKVTDQLSVAFGANVQYAKARLSDALDMGGICRIFGAERGVTPEICDALGLRPGTVDGHARISGDHWGFGWNLGLLYTPTPRTRIGIAYRSPIEHELKGDAKFYVPKEAAILRDASGALVETAAKATLEVPERVGLGAAHEVAPGWTILADVVWTHWGRFDQLAVRFANPKQPTVVQIQGWEDSFRYALGLRWEMDRVWTFRIGTAYDESAIPTAALRTPRVPDADRYWIAAGLGFRPFERVRLDVGYAHLFSPNVAVDNADPVTHHRLTGDFDVAADVIGIQLTWDVGWPPLGERITP